MAYEHLRTIPTKRPGSTASAGVETTTSTSAPLTRRETEVLALVRAGLKNKEIARRLGISLDTAREHVSNIKRKTGVVSVVALSDLHPAEADNWLENIELCDGMISRTEIIVLRHLCRGLSSKQIAQLLKLSPRTVQKHRENLLRKFNLHGTRELVARVVRQYAKCGVEPSRRDR